MTTDFFPLEKTIAGRLEMEAIRYANEVMIARASGDKDGAKEAQRAANAFSKALLYWQDGIRPEMTEAGNWLLPSQRPGEPPHLLHMSGDWCCTCPSGPAWHWASAMIVGVEMGYDDAGLERGDCLDRLHTALEDAERVLWADEEAEARQRRYQQAEREMMELYA